MAYGEAFQIKFSCPFNFETFPFDSHKCCLTYGDLADGSDNLILMPALILYDNMTTDDGPIIINNLPFSFDLTLESQQTLTKFDKLDDTNHSYTGMCLTAKRKRSLGQFRQLLGSFYYPMASFALLSMISFLIKPDVVSTLIQSYIQNVIT